MHWMHWFEWKISNWGLGRSATLHFLVLVLEEQEVSHLEVGMADRSFFSHFEVDMKHPSLALFVFGKLSWFAGLDIDAESEEIWSRSMWRRCVSSVDLWQWQTDTHKWQTHSGRMPRRCSLQHLATLLCSLTPSQFARMNIGGADGKLKTKARSQEVCDTMWEVLAEFATHHGPILKE